LRKSLHDDRVRIPNVAINIFIFFFMALKFLIL